MNRSLSKWLILAAICLAQGVEAAEELLPTNPSMWLNSPPLSVESLKGKGVVLWFYEENCPSCRGKWPGMYELANKYKGQPVVFIAVNSGNPPAAVAQYAKEVKLNWPIIVDPTRQFEQQWLQNEISLQNIHQCMLIRPDGEKGVGSWSNLDNSVQQVLKDASWNIDPSTIPAAFLPTWQQVELGNYAAAANLIKKGLATKNTEVKEAAARVNDYVQQQLSAAVAAAANSRASGNEWIAYQHYRGLTAKFAGYDLPAEVSLASKELAESAVVKKELEAAKALDAIKKSITTARSDLARKRIITRLEQLVEQFAQTEAAGEAQKFLAQAPAQP